MNKPNLCIDNQKISYDININESKCLRAVGITNKITGCHFDLGWGNELKVWIDTAISRIEINRWKMVATSSSNTDADDDVGFRNGYFEVQVDDKEWQKAVVPINIDGHTSTIGEDRYTWARTCFVLPNFAGKSVTIVLGGYGLYDYDWTRIFLNGKEILLRVENKAWREPAVFHLNHEDTDYQLLNFGGNNILALQMKGYRKEHVKLQEANKLDSRNNMKMGSFAPFLFDQYITVGESSEAIDFVVCSHKEQNKNNRKELITQLEASGKPIHAEIRYVLEKDSATMHKFTTIKNLSPDSISLLDVELGDYKTNSVITSKQDEVGFPVYVDDQLFFSLAHPAGLSQGFNGRIRLRQFPGKVLKPGDEIKLMEVVMGVSQKGEAQPAFREHILKRCRRIFRKHDKPYAIFETHSGWEKEEHGFYMDEKLVLDMLDTLRRMKEQAGLCFDFISLEFWMDTAGDLTNFYKSGSMCNYLLQDYSYIKDADGFYKSGWPEGPKRMLDRVSNLGISLGLWFDCSWGRWTIGRNPATIFCRTTTEITSVPGPGLAHYHPDYMENNSNNPWGDLCRASEPFHNLFQQGLRFHIHENGIRMIKLDNLVKNCWNPSHGHRVGKYSVEAICNSVIEDLKVWDKENPDIFIIGYWGYRSPWWLLWTDTIFESGLEHEASVPLGWQWEMEYKRDSVIRAVDQGHWYACHKGDIPSLCKDSLGVWLAPHIWNSEMGKERWQEGLIMDLCRGNLILQPWGINPKWFTGEDVKELAGFEKLLKEYPECFRNSRFILGNPWKDNLYGYLCSDGKRAFISINNGGPTDTVAELNLTPEWGFSEKSAWQIFQKWPRSQKYFTSDGKRVSSGNISLNIKPWDIVLLEIIHIEKEKI